MSEQERFPNHYGDKYVGGYLAERDTIHGTGKIDVEIDPSTKEVTAIWFRCLNLPFQVCVRDNPVHINPDTTIVAIEYLEELTKDG